MLEHAAWPAEQASRRPFGGLARRVLDWGTAGNDTPAGVGPGRYAPGGAARAAAGREGFGGAPRFDAGPPADGPGPGFYAGAPEPRGAGPSLQRAERPELWDGIVRITPAPGEYDPHALEDAAKRAAALRVMHPDFKSREIRDPLANREPNPGAAAYYPKLKNGKAAKFPKGTRFTPQNFCGPQPLDENPAPGQYGAAPDLFRVPGAVITASKMAVKRRGQVSTPGPPDYQDPTKSTFIHPSANVHFDPSRQPIRKYEGV
jgi:hypothetical protein